jgi:carbon monoxide dehydrogenase subunit G
MKPILVARRVAAPPERVWALVTDFEGAPARISGIAKVEALTPGPPGPGYRFRETRRFGKRESSEVMTVAEWSPPRSYVLTAASCGAEYRSEMRCVPDGGGTRLEMEFTGRPVSFFAKLLSPLLGFMAGALRKCIEKDLDEIARAAESR